VLIWTVGTPSAAIRSASSVVAMSPSTAPMRNSSRSGSTVRVMRLVDGEDSRRVQPGAVGGGQLVVGAHNLFDDRNEPGHNLFSLSRRQVMILPCLALKDKGRCAHIEKVVQTAGYSRNLHHFLEQRS
jgi:hypothetical protein